MLRKTFISTKAKTKRSKYLSGKTLSYCTKTCKLFDGFREMFQLQILLKNAHCTYSPNYETLLWWYLYNWSPKQWINHSKMLFVRFWTQFIQFIFSNWWIWMISVAAHESGQISAYWTRLLNILNVTHVFVCEYVPAFVISLIDSNCEINKPKKFTFRFHLILNCELLWFNSQWLNLFTVWTFDII